MEKLKYFLENNLFGVCTKIGQKLGFEASVIRNYFIYASFFTLGSPVVIYMILAFWMEVRKTIRANHNPTVWEF